MHHFACAILTILASLWSFELCSNLKKEGEALLSVISGATAGAEWEVLLGMVGTNDFGATYP